MSRHHRILLLVSTGVFMSTMDSSMVNVALPTLMQVFSSTLALTEWVVLVYLLTITVSLLFWGYLSGRTGQGVLYSHGLLLFSLGSFLCAAAPSIGLLIVFRFIQACGGAMMMAMGPALIKSSYPRDQLGRGLGMIGIATSIGLMTGPAVSGLLLRWAHWRWIFLVTVPVGLLLFLVGRSVVGSIGKSRGEERNSGQTLSFTDLQQFDFIGSLLYITAVLVSVLFLTHATLSCCGEEGRITLFGGAALSVLLWIMLIVHEKRKLKPLFPVHLLARRFFSLTMFSAMLSFTVLFFVLLLMPFYLSSVRGYSPDRVGYFMMAVPLCVFFIAPLAGHLHDVIGGRIIATAGLFFCFVALLLLTRLHAQTPPFYLAGSLALLGFGQAMFLAPNSAAALSSVSRGESGITSSLLATSRNMGMLLGTALAGLVFAATYSDLTGGLDVKDFTPDQTPAFLQALRRTFQVSAGVAFFAVTVSWLRGKQQRGERGSTEDSVGGLRWG